MESKVNIAKAIIKVMQAVKGMEKNSRVGEGTGSAYNGTKDQDVKEVFNEALALNGLCIMPINIEENTQIDRWEEIDQWSKSTPKATKQKQSVFTKVKVKYLLLHDSGESIELMGYGHGVDSQDKGAGKATTYALKNCLLYTFLTPVGKIDDTETTHSEEIKTPQKSFEKQVLPEGGEKFEAAKKYIQDGGTIDDISKKYILTENVIKLLINK
jgi:hypothetical protein